jgi:phosphate transport system substrate-binding protein
MNFRIRTASLVLATLGCAGLAGAQDVTGAGASFPAPLYAKWASDYHKATGVKVNYQSVGSARASSRSRPGRSISAPPTCR